MNNNASIQTQTSITTIDGMEDLFEKKGAVRRKSLTPFQFRKLIQTKESVISTISDFYNTEKIVVSSDALTITNSPVHAHDYYELAFVRGGNYYVKIEDKEYTFLKGDLLLLNRNTKHTEKNSFSESQKCYLCFDEVFFEDYIAKFGNISKPNGIIDGFFKNNATNNILNNKDYILFRPISDYSVVTEIFNEIENVITNRPNYMMASIYYLIGKLFYILEDGKTYSETYVDLGNFPELKIAENTKNIIKKARGNISRAEIATILGYSENHIYRTFKKVYGTSVKEFSQAEQMKAAAELLFDFSLSIADVAVKTGIENRTQFYKLFEQTYSCTPKEYRERLKTIKPDLSQNT